MVRVEVLVVGKELLIGRTLNTNAHWVGRRLALMGSMISRMSTVDDDLGEISSAIEEILRREPDFVIVMGGLGPTPDDMTLEGVARGLRRKILMNKEALALIKEHYKGIGRASVGMTPARRKMAMLPEGSSPLQNELGTAPGVKIVVDGTEVYCLPGVPSEMRSIFRNSVEGPIKSKVGRVYREAVRMRIDGVYESSLAPFISRELARHPGAYIKSHPRGLKEGVSRVELDVVVVSRNRNDARSQVSEIADFMASEVIKAGGGFRTILGARREGEH